MIYYWYVPVRFDAWKISFIKSRPHFGVSALRQLWTLHTETLMSVLLCNCAHYKMNMVDVHAIFLD
jgi:hypothetical protein